MKRVAAIVPGGQAKQYGLVVAGSKALTADAWFGWESYSQKDPWHAITFIPSTSD